MRLIRFFTTRGTHLIGKIGLLLAHSSFKKHQTPTDKVRTWMLARYFNDPSGAEDHMQDEFVEAGVEFSPEELRAFERSK